MPILAGFIFAAGALVCFWRALRNAHIAAWAAAIDRGDMTVPGQGGPWRSSVTTRAGARRAAAYFLFAAWTWGFAALVVMAAAGAAWSGL